MLVTLEDFLLLAPFVMQPIQLPLLFLLVFAELPLQALNLLLLEGQKLVLFLESYKQDLRLAVIRCVNRFVTNVIIYVTAVNRFVIKRV